MGPADQLRARARNVRNSTGSVTTADQQAQPLSVDCIADIFGKLRVERGHYKDVEFEFKGVAPSIGTDASKRYQPPTLEGEWLRKKYRRVNLEM